MWSPCRTLGALAEKCHAFAKALHYKELEYETSADTAVEALNSINNQLRQPEAAIGILTLAQTQLHMELKARALLGSLRHNDIELNLWVVKSCQASGRILGLSAGNSW